MRKKLLLAVFCLGIVLSISLIQKEPPPFPKVCPFCDPQILQRQTFYEDEQVLALYTHKPIFSGHCLILPKRHVEVFHELSSEEMTQISKTIQKVHVAVSKVFQTSSYLLLEKNGRELGQSVPHVHFHYISRKPKNFSAFTFLLRMFFVNAMPPISKQEIEEKVSLLRQAIFEASSPN